MKQTGIRAVGALALLIAALGFAACSKSLDVDDLESKLAAQAAPELGASEEAVEVSCPEDVDVETGTTFDCDATFEGQEATIEVELTDDDGTYIARLK